MGGILLNVAVIAIALVVLFSVWIGVHLLARHRMGDRKLGCRGPSVDEFGNSVCCNSGAACERVDATSHEEQRRMAAGE